MGADMEFLFDLGVGVRAPPPPGVDINGMDHGLQAWLQMDCKENEILPLDALRAIVVLAQ